jgi:hypothetical protein
MQVWEARAAAARERVEKVVEQLYELDPATLQHVRDASCNTGR